MNPFPPLVLKEGAAQGQICWGNVRMWRDEGGDVRTPRFHSEGLHWLRNLRVWGGDLTKKREGINAPLPHSLAVILFPSQLELRAKDLLADATD